MFCDQHRKQDLMALILSRFVCHRLGFGLGSNWSSYMSNLANLGVRNSMEMFVSPFKAPLENRIFKPNDRGFEKQPSTL